MKLISALTNKDLRLGDVLLKKGTSKSMSSEQYFHIEEQPLPTCPIIDIAFEKNQGEIDRLISLEKELSEMLPPAPHEECVQCGNREIYKSASSHIQQNLEDIHSFQSDVEFINAFLEELRGACEEVRVYGNDLKKLLWQSFDMSEEQILEELNEIPRPQSSITSGQFYEKYNSLIPEVKDIEVDPCLSECSNFKAVTTLCEITEKIHNFEVTFPVEVEMSLTNYSNIQSWAGEVLQIIGNVDRRRKSFDLDLEISDYLKLKNKEQIERFTEFVTKARIIPIITPTEEIEEYKESTEDFVKTREIQLHFDLYNNFAEKYNQSLLNKFNVDPLEISQLISNATEVRHMFFTLDETPLSRERVLRILGKLINDLEHNAVQIYRIEK